MANRTASNAKIGKANPVRDLCLLVGIIAVLLWFTIDLDKGMGVVPREGQEQEGTQSGLLGPLGVLKMVAEQTDLLMTSVHTMMESKMASVLEQKTRQEPCSMYLFRRSTIPTVVGQALYAGRDFQKGDILTLNEQEAYTTLSYPIDSDRNRNENSKDTLVVPVHALLLNHHPSLVNVQITSQGLQVTKPIAVGSELFVDYDQDLHRFPLFRDIPTLSDYQLVDRIRASADVKAGISLDPTTPSQPMPKKASAKLATTIYASVKDAVNHLDSKVSTLLPSSIQEARGHFDVWRQQQQQQHQKKSGNDAVSAIASLVYFDAAFINALGVCVGPGDDIQVQEQPENNHGSRLVAARSVKKDDIITRIPIHVIPNQEKESCDADESKERESYSYQNCLGVTTSRLLLCPLLHNDLLRTTVDTGTDGDSSKLITLQWTNQDMPQQSVEDVLRAPAGALSFDIIALNDIAKGDELRWENNVQETLTPDHWLLSE